MIPNQNQPGTGGIKPERMERVESPHLQRIRYLSQLLDNFIPLPGGYKIGLDPIIGLVPTVGDALTTAVSLYLVYESALLGLPKRVLLKMIGNVVLDSLIGNVPILGDAFDLVWKANMRNVRLVESAYHPGLKERPERQVRLTIGLILLLILAGLLGITALALWAIIALVKSVAQAF